MASNTKNGFFVSGTNTEVGKTFVTSLLAQALLRLGMSVGVYKPVASGCEQRDGRLISEDAEQLWLGAGKPKTMDEVAPQKFLAPLAPNVAAKAEGRSVDSGLLRSGLAAWTGYDVTLVEGVGGLMSPISDSDLVVDLAAEFDYPLLVVVANQLGCISQALLTVEYARLRGLTVAGIVLNAATRETDTSHDSNLEQLNKWSNVPVVATVKRNAEQIDLSQLQPWLPK